jgi:RNase P/RNase MRP subunit p29
MDREKDNSETNKLDTLTKDLKRLQIQISKVTKRINNIQSKQNIEGPIVKDKKQVLKIGDTVIVTGTYRNRKGVTGTVVKITPAQIGLKPSDRKDKFQIYKQNAKLA